MYVANMRRELAEAKEAYGLQCENVAVLRGLVNEAFVAGARWGIRGLPVTFAEDAAAGAFERWLTEVSGGS